MKKIVPGDLYRHFKGGLYQIVTVARDSETLEELVVYQALYKDFIVYVRPVQNFFEKIDKEQYPQADQTYMFEQVDRSSLSEASIKEDSIYIDDIKPEETKEETVTGKDISKNKEEGLINPVLEEFLEADEFSDKLEVLKKRRQQIDEHIMCSIEISLDLSVSEEDIDDRIARVQKYLMTQSKFDVRRLR